MSEYESIWAKICAAPDRRTSPHFHPWTNDEDWMLWEMWERKRQPDTAKALNRAVGPCRERFEMLQKQGGPEGKRPEWME